MWWGATLTVVLAVAHNLSKPSPRTFMPHVLLARVTAYTHHMPKSWRGKERTLDVMQQFQHLYKH